MMTAMSSAFLRFAFTALGGASSRRTDSADGPRLPSATPKSTVGSFASTAVPSGSASCC